MVAKHFLIYNHRRTGTYVVTEPHSWAPENQHHFPNFSFQPNNHPTPIEIEKRLIDNRNFRKVVNTADIVVVQNLDPNLTL